MSQQKGGMGELENRQCFQGPGLGSHALRDGQIQSLSFSHFCARHLLVLELLTIKVHLKG